MTITDEDVELALRTLARRRSGLKMRHERDSWANCHWPNFVDDARTTLAHIEAHLTQNPPTERESS